MFYWDSAPPKRLKTTGLEKCIVAGNWRSRGAGISLTILKDQNGWDWGGRGWGQGGY